MLFQNARNSGHIPGNRLIKGQRQLIPVDARRVADGPGQIDHDTGEIRMFSSPHGDRFGRLDAARREHHGDQKPEPPRA